MFEVVIERIGYVRDVPVELTKAALAAGVLCKGSVVGLMVFSPSGSGERILLEARLDDVGQVGLVKVGLTVPLEEGSGILRFSEDWRRYLPTESGIVEYPVEQINFGGSRRRPTPALE
jgi:hypothetical protein